MPTVNIDGDASGAIAACAAAQGAIDALHGKSVNVDVNVRQSGGGMGEATRGMQDFGQAADRAGRSTRGMGDDLGRSAGHARGMADHMHRAGSEIDRASRSAQGMGNELERGSGHMGAIAGHAEVVRGAIGSGASGMREIGSGAASAGRDMRALESGASRAGLAMRGVTPSGGIGGGAIKDAIIDMHKLADGTYGVAEAMKAIGSRDLRHGGSNDPWGGGGTSGGGGAPKPFSWSGVRPEDMGSTMGGGRRPGAGGAGGGGGFSWAGANPGDIGYTGNQPEDRSSRSNDAAGGRRSPAVDRMREMQAAAEDLGGGLGGVAGAAAPTARSLMGVGLAAGVSTIGMGALTAAVAGVGLAGVGEDIAHNSQLMGQGEKAIRGFNKGFSEMRSESSAAGMPQMAGLKSSLAGVGHELAGIGAKNIGPALGAATALGNSATAAMKQLEPSIGPAMNAVTALGGAVLGAFGSSGPAVTGFANNLTAHAPQIQSTTSKMIDLMAGLGNAAVDTYAGISNVDDAVKSVVQPGGKPGVQSSPLAQWVGGLGQSMLGGKSFSPLSAHPAGTSSFSPEAAPNAPKPGGGGSAPSISQDEYLGIKPGSSRSNHPAHPMGDFGFPGMPKLPPGGGGGSPDAARFAGMTGGQVLTAQRADAGLPPVGQPRYNGLGPRGAGQSVGPMPASTAVGLGGGGIAPLNAMQSALSQSVGGGGASTGQAMVQHIQKAVNTAAPAASAGGAAIGGAMNAGMAQGSTSSQSVVDTVIIKHSKHIIDLATGVLGVHSPSTEFDFLGRMTGLGYAQGVVRESHRAGSAVSGMFDQHKFGYDNVDGSAPVISVRKQSPTQAGGAQAQGAPARQYGSEAMGRFDAHNQRAGALAGRREDNQRAAIGGMTHDERRDQLAQGRADLHAKAMANLGAMNPATGQRWQDPSKNANPFGGDQHPSLWKSITQGGPLGDLKNQFSQHGESMTQGVGVGLEKGQAGAQNKMSQFSRGMQNQHKKDHGIQSPSTVFASDGMNMAAGVGVGFAAGAPGATSQMTSAAAGMSTALQGPLSDFGLQAGFTYAQAFSDGSSREIKKANYSALGLPTGLSSSAMSSLIPTGLLRAGSGASTTKTASGASAVVTLSSAVAPPQTITIQVQHMEGDRMADVADQQIQLWFDTATGTYGTL